MSLSLPMRNRFFQHLSRTALRLLVGGFHQLRRSLWFISRPTSFGVHAMPITPSGTIVLVKLRYARGWRLPGGGRKSGEDPAEAVLRELREEIGMIRHGSVELAAEVKEDPDFKSDTSSLFVVREVEYSPRWSFEIEEVVEAQLDRLPRDMSPRALRWLAAISAGPLGDRLIGTR